MFSPQASGIKVPFVLKMISRKAQQSNIAKGIRLKKEIKVPKVLGIWKCEVLMDKCMGLTCDSMDDI